jgi:hypothetical protein
LNLEVSADLAGEVVVDLAMPRDRRRLARLPIDVDGVSAALAKKLAAESLEMSN